MLELDNASARLNGRGLIQGTSPWTSRRGKVEDLLLIGSPAAPILLFPWAGTKVVMSAFLHPRIRLQPGLELTLVADEDTDIPGWFLSRLTQPQDRAGAGLATAPDLCSQRSPRV